MKSIYQMIGLTLLVLSTSLSVESAHHKDPLYEAVNNPNRNAKYSARDSFRNPYETLSFFKIKPSMNVLELAAGGGWYTEILAPYLFSTGKLSVTHHNPEAGSYQKRSRTSFDQKVSNNPLFKCVNVITCL